MRMTSQGLTHIKVQNMCRKSVCSWSLSVKWHSALIHFSNVLVIAVTVWGILNSWITLVCVFFHGKTLKKISHTNISVNIKLANPTRFILIFPPGFKHWSVIKQIRYYFKIDKLYYLNNQLGMLKKNISSVDKVWHQEHPGNWK